MFSQVSVCSQRMGWVSLIPCFFWERVSLVQIPSGGGGGVCPGVGMSGGQVCPGGGYSPQTWDLTTTHTRPYTVPQNWDTVRYGRKAGGRYASYWNAILFHDNSCKIVANNRSMLTYTRFTLTSVYFSTRNVITVVVDFMFCGGWHEKWTYSSCSEQKMMMILDFKSIRTCLPNRRRRAKEAWPSLILHLSADGFPWPERFLIMLLTRSVFWSDCLWEVKSLEVIKTYGAINFTKNINGTVNFAKWSSILHWIELHNTPTVDL